MSATDAKATRRDSESGSRKLQAQIVAGIRDSLLPGDGPFEPEWVEGAAAFLLAAARVREPGEPVIELASTTEGRRHLRIALINDDMPFLVDSVAAAITAMGVAIDRLVHPVLSVERDAAGKLEALADRGQAGTLRESMIYLETARADARQRRELVKVLAATLADVRATVHDWPRMVEVMNQDADRTDDAEGAELLRWFAEGNLTQLGHVTRKRDGGHAQLLGICRRGAKAILADASYERAFAAFDMALANRTLRAPMILKANHLATVHRRVPLDLFLVPVIDAGVVTAISVHAGLWTSAALNTAPDRVPRLRQQLDNLGARLGFDPKGHTGKALTHALTALPHDLVVSFEDADVERVATTMTSLVDRPRPRLLLVEAPLARHLLAFVWLPRDQLSSQMRGRIQALLEQATGARTLDWSMQVEAGALAMLRYVLDIRDSGAIPDEEELGRQVQILLRGWSEAVEAAITAQGEGSRAVAIAARYAEAFPMGYRADYGPSEAAIDIRHLRRLAGSEAEIASGPHRRRDARLYRMPGDHSERLRLKIYQNESSLPLSDAVPALENFGFRVLEEIPTSLDRGRMGTIHDFLLELPAGEEAASLIERAGAIEEAFAQVLNGEAENDPFNRLVVTAALEAEESNWLRAFYRYLRQAGTSYTITTVVEALGRAPQITSGIVSYFRARHDPAFKGDRRAAEESAAEAVRAGLAGVTAINDDRVLRLYRSLVEAVLRTNAFASAAQEALAFKLDSALVPGLPKPVPWREIFVYSRRVEGIHLRAGPIARGGLRWSDRRDDFRVEVLGLMKAQRVKNAVIVPTGAKGGFYPKQLPDPQRDRAGWAAEGQGAYEVFVRTLLSVTDNIVDGQVEHPQGVLVRDGEDPYFVVAADKGTAKFSDVANAIAAERDFWLDDAFASGGSKGYDHKAMGITARGAWLSVQRHFLEMGIDVQTDPVTVVGCGDMSGDVFGNGMLLSRAIRLVAAFDHRHIFLDPDPDPAKSWAERRRLFDLPSSSWDDYDKALISKGGGVFARTMKRVPLSQDIRALLGTDAAEMEPEALIAAILQAPVDLLWFGGIGTYVKASSENNATVGDPANDPVRVDGAMVRAKVIGEGANLGVTQAGRIEFALRGGAAGQDGAEAGGRINTDFIDNSAGVDCSDNEVNIKIALAAAKRAGKLTEPKRVALLRDMTDEVAELVLEDNRLQALALSIAQRGGAKAIPPYSRLIDTLEDTGNLDRRTEGLADGETLARRALDGKGLTRPELAVLLSSAKLVLQGAIEDSQVAGDPSLEPLLLKAFPSLMRVRFEKFIKEHRLAPEIIATKLANRMVNRLGVIHPFELAEEEGAELGHVAAAFALADRLFELEALWRAMEEAPMPETARLALFDAMAHAVRGHMADLLRAGAGRLAPAVLAERLEAGIAALATETRDLLAEQGREHSHRISAALVAEGVPDKQAAAVTHLFDLDGAVGIAALAQQAKIAPRRLVAAFTRLGSALGLDWAQNTAALMTPSDPWERLLVAGLARDFQQMRLEFLLELAQSKANRDDPVAAVEAWAAAHESAIRTFRAMVTRAEASVPAPAMLAQVASQARNLLGRRSG